MTECILWPGKTQSNGYGYFMDHGKKIYAHRAAYIKEQGAIPEGLETHHICGNKLCTNPKHVVVVDESKHGFYHYSLQLKSDHCGNGHRFNDKNTRMRKTKRGRWRYCWECQKAYRRNHRLKTRDQ